MEREKSCGAVVYRESQDITEVLLIRHRKGRHWSFPKGHVEAGETEMQTATREIEEETGLQATVNPEFKDVISYTMPNGICKDVVYFAATVSGGMEKIQAEEVVEMGWFSFEDAGNTLSHNASRGVLHKFIQWHNTVCCLKTMP